MWHLPCKITLAVASWETIRLQNVFSQVTQGSWEPTDAVSCFAHLGSRIRDFGIGLVQWNASANKRVAHICTYTKIVCVIAQLRTTFWHPTSTLCHCFLHERYSLPTNLLESYNKIPNHLFEIDTSFRSSTIESFWISRSKKNSLLIIWIQQATAAQCIHFTRNGQKSSRTSILRLQPRKIKEHIRISARVEAKKYKKETTYKKTHRDWERFKNL